MLPEVQQEDTGGLTLAANGRSTDDILSELFKEQVDTGIADAAEGRTVTHEGPKTAARQAAHRSVGGELR